MSSEFENTETVERQENKSHSLKWQSVVIIAAVTVVILGVVLFVGIKKRNFKNAFNSETYNDAVVNVTVTMEDMDAEVEETDSSDTSSDTASEGTAYYSNISGNSGDDSTGYTGISEYTVTLKKDGDVYYEDSDSGEFYFYDKDGKNYVAFYYDLEGLMEESGTWGEAEADEWGVKPVFDFSVLDKVDPAAVKKDGDKYIPENTDGIFYSILSVTDPSDYTDRKVEFYVSGSKIEKIVLSYTYDGRIGHTDTYEFEYTDVSLELPEIGTESEE